jgi:hypothetical protein
MSGGRNDERRTHCKEASPGTVEAAISQAIAVLGFAENFPASTFSVRAGLWLQRHSICSRHAALQRTVASEGRRK